jgi:hypothetical protein
MTDPSYKSEGFTTNPPLIKPFYHEWIGSPVEHTHLKKGGILRNIHPEAFGITPQNNRQKILRKGGSTLRIQKIQSENRFESPINVQHKSYHETFKTDRDTQPNINIFHHNWMQYRNNHQKLNP